MRIPYGTEFSNATEMYCIESAKPATTSRVGLKYNTYTPEQRAEIGMLLRVATLVQQDISRRYLTSRCMAC